MAALDDVVKHFVSSKKLKPADSTALVGWIARQQVYFFRRRAEEIAKIVPAWLTATNHLRDRLEAEYTELDKFLVKQVGKGTAKGPLVPLLGGNASLDKTPRHLDLKDLAHRRTSENPTGKTVTSRAKNLTLARLAKVHGIVWRAGALHGDVWTDVPAPGRTGATLAAGVLDEILDRRLRTLERMQYQVAVVGAPERDENQQGAGGLGDRIALKHWGKGLDAVKKRWGPWKDGFRIRLFEYPRLPGKKKEIEQLLDPTSRGEIAEPSPLKFFDTGHDDRADVDKAPVADHRHWQWHSPAKSRAAWRVLPPKMVGLGGLNAWRFPPSKRDDWEPFPTNPYNVCLKPRAGKVGSAVLDELFDHTSGAVADWWQRAWLWCDHVISAIHLDALLFAQRRRLGVAAGEARFNRLVAATAPPDLPAGGEVPYVRLLAPVGIEDRDDDKTLVSHVNSPHFDEQLLRVRDLQLGDHVVFWNHVLYGMLTLGGDWRLENALVMSLDNSANGVVARATDLRLQGHGTVVTRYTSYQHEIASKIEGALEAAQKAVRDALRNLPPSSWPLSIPHGGATLAMWSPYTTMDRVKFRDGTIRVGAWWVEIPFASAPISRNKPGTDPPVPRTADEYRDAVLAAFPKTVGRRSSPGPAHTPPMNPMAAYFPLFQPRLAVDLITATSPKVVTKKLTGWDAYLAWHEQRPKLKKPPATLTNLMDPVVMDGSLVPGLFLRQDKKFTVVRPLVK